MTPAPLSTPEARPRPTRELLRCELPTMSARGVVVERFTVEENSFLENLMLAFQGRSCAPGEYTRLIVDGTLWMSDTSAETRDHMPALYAAEARGGRGLMHGLGLGCILTGWLHYLDHVDVVEVNERVADVIGSVFVERYPGRVTVHVGDAFTYRFPKGTRWDVAWHDVWPTMSTDMLDEMAVLHRRYGGRVGWQDSWGRTEMLRERRQERRWL